MEPMGKFHIHKTVKFTETKDDAPTQQITPQKPTSNADAFAAVFFLGFMAIVVVLMLFMALVTHR